MSRSKAQPYFLALALYALLVAAYVGLRFGWRWLDADAASLTILSQNVHNEGTLVPAAGAYALGYAYPALNTFLARATGVPVTILQTYVQPFLFALLVPVSYAAFRVLLGNRAVAALACLLLLLQPDLLFEGVRSSHAKFTWLLALGMLFVLSRSFQVEGSNRAFARWVLLFYMMAYGLISSNAFFASSYVFGLAFAFLGGWVLARWQRTPQASEGRLRRLLYVALACSVLVFLVAFYLYPPVQRQAWFLRTTIDRVAGFVLDVETGANPYRYVQVTWLSPGLYVMLSSLSWLVLGLSFVNWVQKGWALLGRRQTFPPGQLLLWLLYTGFAFLLALGVALDLAGTLSANLQVRLFPHVMIMAIPLAAEMVGRLVAGAWRRGRAARRAAVALLAVAALFFSAASLFKATNEPLLSNLWVFYSPGERAAAGWAGPHLAGPWVWLGPNNRLKPMLRLFGDWEEAGLSEYTGQTVADRYDLLLSEVTKMQAARLAMPLPEVWRRLRVYDNGDAALYHARPRTPYQQ